MPYRKTKRSREQLARMQEGKARARMERALPDYPHALPDLRRRIIITDFDFGECIHTLDLYRTRRIDCFRVVVDGQPWKSRIGWSKILDEVQMRLDQALAAANARIEQMPARDPDSRPARVRGAGRD